jgi:hypothetical protein
MDQCSWKALCSLSVVAEVKSSVSVARKLWVSCVVMRRRLVRVFALSPVHNNVALWSDVPTYTPRALFRNQIEDGTDTALNPYSRARHCRRENGNGIQKELAIVVRVVLDLAKNRIHTINHRIFVNTTSPFLSALLCACRASERSEAATKQPDHASHDNIQQGRLSAPAEGCCREYEHMLQ